METAATARPPALIASIILLAAAMLAVADARPAHAQSNAAPLWREAFRAAGYGTANPLLSAEDVNFMIDATARGTALGPAERARMADLMERTADVRRQFAAAARVRLRLRSRRCTSAARLRGRTRAARRFATVPISTLRRGSEEIGLHPLWRAQNAI